MNALQLLQQKCGLEPDGDFGENSFKAISKHLQIPTTRRASHFFGQACVESGNFRIFSENLNYSAKRMLEIFKSDFDTNRDKWLSPEEKLKVNSLLGHPDKIANFVYANQNGNGNEDSGDGWKFRGRGIIQLTGRENYLKFSQFMKDPEIMTNPDLVATKYAFESAMFYFNSKKIWIECDKGIDSISITRVSKLVNGGTNGLDDRIKATLKYSKFV